ncbi:MAG: N-acetyltransferase [Rhizobiaceae bacterium]|nr:N-acetyltransferase [Rhizobiaceae bacterium]
MDSVDEGPVPDDAYSVRVAPSIGSFSREEWGSLQGTSGNPFISYEFLTSLEDSGCAVPESGWQGCHLRLENARGELVGAAICYAKLHSQGEYVFDHGWADAFERAGGRYYPKLQSSIPFTPVTGPRLLVRRGDDPRTVKAALATALKSAAAQFNMSSAHVTFAQDDDMIALKAADFLERTDHQFHFFNPGYVSYDDFLSNLSSRKRKALKRERREALSAGIEIEWLTGGDITEEAWDSFFEFYMDTGSRKWGRPYLNRRFFSLIGERMSRDILLIMAKRQDRYIAGALNFIGPDRLYGRNWGCIEDHPFLHFEVCYHQAIDYVIANKLAVVEAGAQGEHKLSRGYVPVTTRSAHFILHAGLRNAVANFLVHERQDEEVAQAYYSEHSPFRRDIG